VIPWTANPPRKNPSNLLQPTDKRCHFSFKLQAASATVSRNHSLVPEPTSST